MYEMTCKDGGNEWWPVHPDDLESAVKDVLVEFGRESPGEFGYGSEETKPCEQHEVYDTGCEDCWNIHCKIADDKVQDWAAKRARVLAGHLVVAIDDATTGWTKVEQMLGDDRIWIKLREAGE